MANIVEELKEKTKEEVEETPAGDFFMGIVLMILSAAVLYVASSWPREGNVASSAALFPVLIASTLFLMAFSLFVTSLRHRGLQRFLHYFTLGYWQGFLTSTTGKLTLLTLSTILVYMILLLRVLSFEAATIIYTAGSLRIFWKAKMTRIIIISVCVTAFYVLSFRYLFRLELPGLGM
ncbi:MAG: tripartite tricarboxylate transporter TctB family protein [Syntrophales bacterium]